MDSRYRIYPKTLWLALWALLSMLAGRAALAESAVVEVPLSQQRSLSFTHAVARVAVGDPEVADVRMLGGRDILVTAKKLGSTSLKVWLRGTAPDRQYTVEVTPADGLRAALKEAGMTARAAGSGIVLEGDVQSLPAHAAAAAAAADAAGGAAKTVDRSRTGFSPQVQTDIKVVEISRRKLKNAGFFLAKNTSSLTAVSSPPGALSSVTGGVGSFALGSQSGFLPGFDSFNLVLGKATKGILGVLSILEGNGFAYTLAEPSLVTLSGQDASFLAGGEFPVPIRQGSGDQSSVTIQYKEFGIRLFLTPSVLSREQIMLRVAPEVSELDFSNGIQSGGVAVPALRVRRTETSVELGDGESFVISGLVSRETVANIDKVPGLGDIPVLGAFFRSSRIDINDRELIMVVTPHLVRALAADAPLPPLPGAQYRKYDPDFADLMFNETGDFDLNDRDYGFSD